MRSRLPVLVVAILLVAAFAAMNWSEVVRPADLLIGPVVTEAPLGLILLSILGITLVAFMVSSTVATSRYNSETRQHLRSLEASRELADKAEASRFVELRNHLDTQLRELRQRDAIAATEIEKAMVNSQRELRTQLEQMNRTMAARLTELEHRLDARFERTPGLTASAARPTMPQQVRQEHADMAAREAHLREEHAREEKLREERRLAEQRAMDERTVEHREERAVAADQRAAEQQPSGWRRWF